MTTRDVDLIEKLRAIEKAMTAGPWVYNRTLGDVGPLYYVEHAADYRDAPDAQVAPDLDGIAALRNLAPELLAVVEAADNVPRVIERDEVTALACALDALRAKAGLQRELRARLQPRRHGGRAMTTVQREPRERPILFSGPMVRAILDGTKTQTRRVVKPQPEHGAGPCHWSPTGWAARSGHGDGNCTCQPIRCPYGAPGDRLWVRETWAKGWTWLGEQRCVFYRADGAGMAGSEYRPVCPGDTPAASAPNGIKWRPSIHMPRWASRLTLEVTGVRVERLHDISDDDIIAEGVTREIVAAMVGCHPGSIPTPHDAWRLAWTHINGAESWEANPWCWAIEFGKANER